MGCNPHGTQGHDTHGWDMTPMGGTWHPCPGDQPLSSLRQTAFPARRSARSTTARTGGHADASTPSASPTSPVSPSASAQPSSSFN